MSLPNNASILNALFDGNLSDALYTPGAIANWFLHKSAQEKIPIDQMKLQKLMYFAHGWCLAEKNTPLMNEHVEAWEYGPVFPSVYHEFKKYGNQPLPTGVSNYMQELQLNKSDGRLFFVCNTVTNNNDIDALLENVWSKYGSFDAVTLSNMTHRNDPLNPWQMVYEKIKEHNLRSADIPNPFIKDFFDSLKQRNLTH